MTADPSRPERILCSAIWVDDGVAHVHQPMPTGFVIGGHRHSNCIATAARLREHGVIDEEQRAGKSQGFLTSTGRYVDRGEAARIAYLAGQIAEPVRWLCSEDLW